MRRGRQRKPGGWRINTSDLPDNSDIQDDMDDSILDYGLDRTIPRQTYNDRSRDKNLEHLMIRGSCI